MHINTYIICKNPIHLFVLNVNVWKKKKEIYIIDVRKFEYLNILYKKTLCIKILSCVRHNTLVLHSQNLLRIINLS